MVRGDQAIQQDQLSAQCYTMRYDAVQCVWGFSLNAVLVGDEGTGTKISQSFAAPP